MLPLQIIISVFYIKPIYAGKQTKITINNTFQDNF